MQHSRGHHIFSARSHIFPFWRRGSSSSVHHDDDDEEDKYDGTVTQIYKPLSLAAWRVQLQTLTVGLYEVVRLISHVSGGVSATLVRQHRLGCGPLTALKVEQLIHIGGSVDLQTFPQTLKHTTRNYCKFRQKRPEMYM